MPCGSRALYQQTVENRQRLADTKACEGRLNERLLALIGLMRAKPPASSIEVMGALARVFASSQFELVTAAYDELVGTGALALIRDADLRRADLLHAKDELNTLQNRKWRRESFLEDTAAAVVPLHIVMAYLL